MLAPSREGREPGGGGALPIVTTVAADGGADTPIAARAGHVATVTLNRPRVFNAFDRGVIGRLTAVAEKLGADPAVRAIVITGAGGNFSSGADIAELRSLRSVLEARALTQEAHHMMDAIEAYPKPVIAAVLGYAISGGQELCLACDLRVAGESANFGQVEVNIGSIPSWGGTQRLARTVGVAYAKNLIYTGQLLTED